MKRDQHTEKDLKRMNRNVYLSLIEESHLIHYMNLSHDPDLIETMGWHPFEIDEQDRFLSTVEVLTVPYCGDSQPITFSIITVTGDFPIGYVTLKGMNYDTASAEIGIAILDSEYRGIGYGSEALALAVDYIFNAFPIHIIGLSVFPSNTRAIRAYEKVGFETVDVLENTWTMPDGTQRDMLLMELKKENWKSEGQEDIEEAD
jgi:RimJ/RimL family protein N-acetyltransferase